MLFLPISHPQRDEELETTCFTGPLMPENNPTHPVFVPAAQDMGKKITQQHIPRPGWDETVTLSSEQANDEVKQCRTWESPTPGRLCPRPG
jgi:hypothetical protein